VKTCRFAFTWDVQYSRKIAVGRFVGVIIPHDKICIRYYLFEIDGSRKLRIGSIIIIIIIITIMAAPCIVPHEEKIHHESKEILS
jgi:hypothetical protein